MFRPRNYAIAAILQLAFSLYGLVGGLLILPRGAAGIDAAGDAPPYIVIMIATLLGAVGLLSAYGVWRNQRWGVVLTILLRAVDGLLALPGIFFAPTTSLWFSAVGTVIVSAVVIALLLWPASRARSLSGMPHKGGVQ